MHPENCNPCDLEGRLVAAEERGKSNSHRLDNVEKRQNDLDKLVSSFATICNEQEHIKKDVSEIKDDVKTIMGKSGKRWDNLVSEVVKYLALLIIGFALAKAGLG